MLHEQPRIQGLAPGQRSFHWNFLRGQPLGHAKICQNAKTKCGQVQATSTCESLCPESPPHWPRTALWPVNTATLFATVLISAASQTLWQTPAGLLEVRGAHEQFKLCSNGTVRGLRRCTNCEGASVNASSRTARPPSRRKPLPKARASQIFPEIPQILAPVPRGDALSPPAWPQERARAPETTGQRPQARAQDANSR